MPEREEGQDATAVLQIPGGEARWLRTQGAGPRGLGRCRSAQATCQGTEGPGRSVSSDPCPQAQALSLSQALLAALLPAGPGPQRAPPETQAPALLCRLAASQGPTRLPVQPQAWPHDRLAVSSAQKASGPALLAFLRVSAQMAPESPCPMHLCGSRARGHQPEGPEQGPIARCTSERVHS